MEDELGPISIEFIINNDVVKAASEDLNAKLQGTTATAEQMAATVNAAFKGVNIVANLADIDAYNTAMGEVGVETFNALSKADEAIKKVNADLEAGTITAEQYQQRINLINNPSLDPFRATTAQAPVTVTVPNQSPQLVEQLGLIEQLKINERDLKIAIEAANDTTSLQRLNLELQETQANLARMGNIGKVGFDELGNKIVD